MGTIGDIDIFFSIDLTVRFPNTGTGPFTIDGLELRCFADNCVGTTLAQNPDQSTTVVFEAGLGIVTIETTDFFVTESSDCVVKTQVNGLDDQISLDDTLLLIDTDSI